MNKLFFPLSILIFFSSMHGMEKNQKQITLQKIQMLSIRSASGQVDGTHKKVTLQAGQEFAVDFDLREIDENSRWYLQEEVPTGLSLEQTGSISYPYGKIGRVDPVIEKQFWIFKAVTPGTYTLHFVGPDNWDGWYLIGYWTFTITVI